MRVFSFTLVSSYPVLPNEDLQEIEKEFREDRLLSTADYAWRQHEFNGVMYPVLLANIAVPANNETTAVHHIRQAWNSITMNDMTVFYPISDENRHRINHYIESSIKYRNMFNKAIKELEDNAR